MKKRNCRKTSEEIEQHEMAVKIRRMTDAQICNFMNELRSNEHVDMPKISAFAVNEFLMNLSDCKGVGQATIAKLWDYARKRGFLPVNEKGG